MFICQGNSSHLYKLFLAEFADSTEKQSGINSRVRRRKERGKRSSLAEFAKDAEEKRELRILNAPGGACRRLLTADAEDERQTKDRKQITDGQTKS